MSALNSSSSSGVSSSRRTCSGGVTALPLRQRAHAAHLARGPKRGAVEVTATSMPQPMLMKAMAGLSAGVLMFQAVPAMQAAPAFAATASLTEMQLREAEKLYDLMRERTGRDLPRLTSSPNEQVQSPPRFTQAGQDALISQLKSQLERMNALLATEKQLVAADRQELNRLQQAIAQMRAAEAMAPQLMAAPPIAAPPVQVQAEVTTDSNFNALNTLGIGGLGVYVVLQQNRAKSVKEELDSQLSAERVRVQALEAQAAKLRQELAAEQEVVAQLKQQMQQSEQRSRLQYTSEKRQREIATRDNVKAKADLEETRKRIVAAKFEVIAAREQAQAALAAKEKEMQVKLAAAVEREQQRGRLLVTSANRAKMLEEQTSKAAKQMLEAERKRVLATKQEVIAVREKAMATLAAKEKEMAAKMEQAIEKEKQFGRLSLASAKRESMLAQRTNNEVKQLAEADRKRMLATKMEIIAVREKAHAALVAKEQEMTAKMQQAVEKEQQLGRLWLTSAKRESMMAQRTNEEIKKTAETDRKRMLATKMEIITVREKAHASLIAKEQEMTVKMEKAIEKEQQMARLSLTSAKRESMLAQRTNNEVKAMAESDRKRMLATKMEIIAVREKAHASLVAKEQEMTVKMEQAVEKEKQMGRLWLNSARRESMLAQRTNNEVKAMAESDRKRMLATKMEIIAVREKAHATVIAKEQEMTAKMNQALEKEKQNGRLALTSAKRESMLAQRTNNEVKAMAESDRKRMLATKMEIISVREKAHAALVAKEQEMTAKMQQAVEKEQQLGRLWLTSSKRENMLAQKALQQAQQALDSDRKRMVAAKREAIAAREQAQADRVAREAAAAARLKEVIEREEQRSRLQMASARRENMLLQREAEAVKKASDNDRKLLIAAKSAVLATMGKAVADRLALEKEMMAKMKAEVEKAQQLGRLGVASERRQVMEAQRAVAAATKTLEAEKKQRIAAKSEAMTYREQMVAEKNERMAVAAELERLLAGKDGTAAPQVQQQAVKRSDIIQMVGTDTTKPVKPQQDTRAAITAAEQEARSLQTELQAVKGQVQAATSQIAAMQQQLEQRQQLPAQLQAEYDILSKKEQQFKAQAESLKSMVAESAAGQDADEVAHLQASLTFAERKATQASASTSALRTRLDEAIQSLSTASADIKTAEAARAAALSRAEQLSKASEAALRRLSELRAAQLSSASQKKADSGYRSDEEEAHAEVAELAEKAKLISVASGAVGSDE